MTQERNGTAPATWSLSRLASLRIPLTVELLLYVLVVGAAILVRFWDLGANALHHDESIHAQWSWDLTRGQYTHSPVFHGPLYYHVQAFLNLLVGATDYTSRLSAALFGVAVVLLPLFLRGRLGQLGTIAAVSFIAFSPTIVYYSRFMREDIYMAAFTLLMVAAMWRYLDGGRDRWLIVFALALAGSYATKEATFLTVAVLLLFTNAVIAINLARQTLIDREIDQPQRRTILSLGLMPYAWAIAALWPFLGGLRRSMAWTSLPRSGDVLVILGTLTIPLLTPVLKSPLASLGIVGVDQLDWPGVCEAVAADASQNRLVLGGVFTIVIAASAFIGLQWRARTWAIAATGAAVLYLTLMTTFWTNFGGLCSGPWGSLDYWLSQQGEVRGNQPWFYYHMLMPAYEFLPLIIAVGGLWWSLVRGTLFSRFLVFWAAGTWLTLSWAGEKMPWLNVHIALPTILLAAWTVQRAWNAWHPRPAIDRTLFMPLLAIAGIAAAATILAVLLPGGPAMVAFRWVILIGAAGLVVALARPFGRRAIPVLLVVVVVGGLGLFSLRAMVYSSFVHGDTPKSLLIYTQSSPDLREVRDDIETLGRVSGRGYELRIAVDSSDAFSWPWAWYLRDYRSVTYHDFSGGMPDGTFDVMLVNQNNTTDVNDALAASEPRFQSPERYPHRWWFDERYKQDMAVGDGGPCTASGGNCGPFHHWINIGHGLHLGPPRLGTIERIASGITDDGWLGTWFAFWRDREPANPPGSIDAFAYFPLNFDRESGTLTAGTVEAPEPGVDDQGRPFFGGAGIGPGQLFAPVDITADDDGNLYVIDRSTRRLQKFDADGNYVAGVDVRASEDGALPESEPWGLGIGPDNQVIVADTFGWRVRVYDSELNPTGVIFGNPPAGGEPGDFDLFGPRDAIVDNDGNIWVTDTGHDRIQVYSTDGEFVRTVGGSGSGEGQFDEPVGLARDDEGTIFVADMLNQRVQYFDPGGEFAGEFAVDGWGGQGVEDKPYLAALSDGRVALSLPSQGEVRVYARDGTLEGTLSAQSDPIVQPYGIVESADGRIWVVEGGSGRVRLFETP